MNKVKFIAITAFSIIATLFLTTCLCYAEKGKDEGEFKAIMAEINSLFSKSEELQQKSSSLDAYEKEMKQQEPRGNTSITRLRQFTIDYPASVYADDAAYIFTQFWLYAPERYLHESRLFLEKYPKASLESLTLDTFLTLNPFAKELGVIDTVKMDICETLYNLKRYEESAKEAKAVIDDLSVKALSVTGYHMLSLNYLYLMKDYEAQNKTEQVRRVCNEAIEKIPIAKNKESFIKKLKELDSVSK